MAINDLTPKLPALTLVGVVFSAGCSSLVLASKSIRVDGQSYRADLAEGQADQERQRAARLAERLRAMGIDPDAL